MSGKLGGQAVLNGVMIRTENYVSTYIRTDEGIKNNVTRYETLTKNPSLNIPIMRGIINLYEMGKIGMEEMSWSANQAVGEEKTSLTDILLTIFLSVTIGIVLFALIPWIVAYNVSTWFSLSYLTTNFIDAGMKVIALITYIYFISKIPDIHEAWKYHAAEHKAINCYESQDDLTVENAMKHSRFLPRCSTTFVILVFILSIFFYSFIPESVSFYTNLILRILFLPIIAGFTYELMLIRGRYDNPITRVLTWPGMQFQRLTTTPAQPKHVTIAVKALKKAVQKEESFESPSD